MGQYAESPSGLKYPAYVAISYRLHCRMMTMLWRALLVVASVTLCSAEVRVLAFTNAASFGHAQPLPGMLVSIFCTGLDGVQETTASDFPLPETLSGAVVTLNGIRMPLLAIAKHAGYQQINAQVPSFEPPDSTTLEIRVDFAGSSGTLRVPWGATIPGELFQDGKGNGLFFRADWSRVTATHPAKGGETLVTFWHRLRRTAAGSVRPAQPDARCSRPYRLGGRCKLISRLADRAAHLCTRGVVGSRTQRRPANPSARP